MSQRIALVTGGSSGIGEHLVLRLREAGYLPYAVSRRMGELACDVRRSEDVVNVCEWIRRRHGRLDVVINAAGVASMNHAVTTPSETMRTILETNVLGTMQVCRETAKLLRHSGHGRIVNFTSVAVPLRLEGEAVYVASKAAVEAYTRVLAKELAQWSITVNAVGPAPILTPMLAKVPTDAVYAVLARLPQDDMGKMDDVWNTVRWLIDEASDAVTGQVIYLGGAG